MTDGTDEQRSTVSLDSLVLDLDELISGGR